MDCLLYRNVHEITLTPKILSSSALFSLNESEKLLLANALPLPNDNFSDSSVKIISCKRFHSKIFHLCLVLLLLQSMLTACMPITIPNTNQYKLELYSKVQRPIKALQKTRTSILITAPEAIVGYQSKQMWYLTKPYNLQAFANNTWFAPPADLLFPLIIQKLQETGIFHAVASSANSDKTDYRLDTQLIELQQNFLSRPSIISLKAKVVLTRVFDNYILGSRLISQKVPCPADTPYGGVLAAVEAANNFTSAVSNFIIAKIGSSEMLSKTNN